MGPVGMPMPLSPDAAASSANLLVFPVVGLFASVHCLGMCSSLVSTYANRVAEHSESRRDGTLTLSIVRQHLLFNVGRTAGYAAIGVLFEFRGSTAFTSVDTITPVSDAVRGIPGIFVGLFTLDFGILHTVRRMHASIRMYPSGISGLFRWMSGHPTNRTDGHMGFPRIVGLGTIHAVLPCPIIYIANFYASTIGDPVRWALGVLGPRTVPKLLTYEPLPGTVSEAQRVSLHRALGAAFLQVGYIPLCHGLTRFAFDVPHHKVPYYHPLT
jgi:sulfite exporter TauE/SafE